MCTKDFYCLFYSLSLRGYGTVHLPAVKLLTPSASMPRSIKAFEENSSVGALGTRANSIRQTLGYAPLNDVKHWISPAAAYMIVVLLSAVSGASFHNSNVELFGTIRNDFLKVQIEKVFSLIGLQKAHLRCEQFLSGSWGRMSLGDLSFISNLSNL